MNPNKVCASFQGRGLKASLLRSGSGSILLRVLVFALSLLMTVVLARALGAKGYGVYAYAMAIVTLLAIPAQVGLPTIIVRETARAEANDRWGLIRGLWGWSGKLVLALSAVLVVIAFFVAWLGRESHDSLQLQTFYAALPLIPLMALGSVRGAALRGLRHVIKGQLPESVLRPSFLIVMILFVYVLLAESVTPKEAMMLHSAAAALAFPVAWSTANAFGADPLPFVMAVAYGASACFLIPFGYQTHLMVYSPGRYRITDFLKIGLPVSVTYSAAVLVITPLIFPF
jgi:di/tricarboxylate transporter